MVRTSSCRHFTAAGRLGLWLLGGGVAGVVPVTIAHARQAAPPQATAAAPLVFRGVTVIDVRTGRHLPNRTVMVVGNRIQALGQSEAVPTPKGARVVEARGKYLIPGLWDMHVHPMSYVDIAYQLFIANGVTGVRDAGSRTSLDTLNRWKREIMAGGRVGPRYLVSGPILDSDSGGTVVAISREPDDATVKVPPALARYIVDSLKAAGADFIKTRHLSRAMYFAVSAEARRVGIPFGGHLPEGGHWPDETENVVDGRIASDSGATFLDHNTWAAVCEDARQEPFDATQCAAAAERFRRNNTWVTVMPVYGVLGAGRTRWILNARRYFPTLSNSPNLPWPISDSEVVALRWPTSTAEWAAIPPGTGEDVGYNSSKSFARWHAAGIPMVVGTDAAVGTTSPSRGMTPGFWVPQALVSYVLAGMTPLEALRMATLNPALALRATDSLGTVAAGKVADLVLLDADPLADIWNVSRVRAVVANGCYYDRAALDRLLVQAELQAAHR